MVNSFGEHCLDFNGHRIRGQRPYALLQPSIGLHGVREALREGARLYPRGGALGYFTYEAGQLFDSAWRPALSPHIPLFRLVCFQELQRTSPAPLGHPIPLLTPEVTGQERDLFLHRVRQIQAYIAAGDIYQANLTHHFLLPRRHTPTELYARLRSLGEAPWGGLLQWPDFAVVSNSPEAFLKLEGAQLTAQPIKGTMGRGRDAAEDEQQIHKLLGSAKDRAENVMIVDLLRNDLGKVCIPGTVQVPELAALRTFPTLHHLVSTVQGTLAPQNDALDAFGAAFPCGSITGAPKVRSMQILSELESVPRGAPMGAMGYFGFDGNMAWNVAIRTATVQDHQVSFHAGCGIVADSDPHLELGEMLIKATALYSAAS